MKNTKKATMKQSASTLIVVWLIVAIPAGWGVSQTIRKSLTLFTSAPPPAAAQSPGH
jgi:hypothetical protein